MFLSGGMLTRYGGRAGNMLRDAVTWAALGLALVAVYSYRGELIPFAGRLAGELIPGSAMIVEENPGGPVEVKIRKRLDGHFTAKVEVNGKPISMIVDTGASTVVLRPEDAKKAGIDTSGLSFTVPVLTANGRTIAARVQARQRLARAAHPAKGRGPGGPARRSHRKPARHELLEPPALL